MSQVPELTIPELLDQPWTKRLARVAAFLLMFGVTGIGTYFFSLGQRITSIEVDRSKRIALSDQNTNNLRGQVIDLQNDMDRVRTDVTSVREDVAEVKGILQQMQRENTASVSAKPPAVHPAPGPMPLLTAVQN